MSARKSKTRRAAPEIAAGRPLPQAKVSKAKVSKAKVPKAKVPRAKVPKAKVPKAKVPKAKVPRAELPHARPVQVIEPQDLAALRTEVATLAEKGQPAPRWNADPQDVQRSVVRLVLALVEFIRKLLERQAVRRMEAGTFTPEETERVGLALMRLEETVHDMAKQFGINPEELNLDLGPIGKLM